MGFYILSIDSIFIFSRPLHTHSPIYIFTPISLTHSMQTCLHASMNMPVVASWNERIDEWIDERYVFFFQYARSVHVLMQSDSIQVCVGVQRAFVG